MKKILLFSLAFLLVTPFMVSADSYAGPYCFEDPSMTTSTYKPERDSIRGTCKEVETKTVVSLDPALRKDYFLGTHAPIKYGCEMGCGFETTYSEYLFLTSDLTLEVQTIGVEESPIQYALFEKKYFVPLLSKMFKESSVSFSESTLPNLGIRIFKKSELDEAQKIQETFAPIMLVPEDVKIDYLNEGRQHFSETYTIYSFNYIEYGKGIYAPKSTLAESQYADFEKSENILSNKDLQISSSGGRNALLSVVPIINQNQ